MQLTVSFLDRLASRYSVEAGEEWFRSRWELGIYASAIYLLLVLVGKRWMQTRPKYSLQHTLFVWNTGLAVFSTIGAIEIFPTLFESLSKGGAKEWICRNEVFTKPRTALWAFLFAMFKMVELADTAFVVLRKQKLNFLHYYHHVTVLMYCWCCFQFHDPVQSSFVLMNLVVHAVMYSYYAIKASGRWLPLWVSQLLTGLQLLQFAVAVWANLYAYWLNRQGYGCPQNGMTFFLAMAMYFSYLLLFSNFFVQRYIFHR